MKTVAIIPIKMNNIRTPGKNTKPFSDGTPLIHLIQKKLKNCHLIDEIYVYCSNMEIKDYLLPDVKFMKRKNKYDTPQADVIEMMKTFTEYIDADLYVQAHATTPFLTSESIDKALCEIQNGDYDSAFAVTKLQDFLWQKCMPVNYNPETIPRTQDMEPYYKETTGLYIFKKNVIQDMHRRIGIKPYLLEVSEIESLDIDEPEDFLIADAVYSFLKEKNTPWIQITGS